MHLRHDPTMHLQLACQHWSNICEDFFNMFTARACWLNRSWYATAVGAIWIVTLPSRSQLMNSNTFSFGALVDATKTLVNTVMCEIVSSSSPAKVLSQKSSRPFNDCKDNNPDFAKACADRVCADNEGFRRLIPGFQGSESRYDT